MLMVMDYMGSNNLVGKVHTPPMKIVGQEYNISSKVFVFVLGSIISFHESFKLALQPSNAPFNPNTKPNMHLIVEGQGIFVNIRGALCLADPPNYEHVLTLIFGVTKKVLEIFLHVDKMITPPLVEICIPENCHIMEQTWKF